MKAMKRRRSTNPDITPSKLRLLSEMLCLVRPEHGLQVKHFIEHHWKSTTYDGIIIVTGYEVVEREVSSAWSSQLEILMTPLRELTEDQVHDVLTSSVWTGWESRVLAVWWCFVNRDSVSG